MEPSRSTASKSTTFSRTPSFKGKCTRETIAAFGDSARMGELVDPVFFRHGKLGQVMPVHAAQGFRLVISA